MAKYRQLQGEHVQPEGDGLRAYGPGEIVESKADLCALFPNKFERVYAPEPAAPPPVVPETPAPAAVAEAPKEAPKKAPATEPLGEDVTEKYPEATEKGLTVWKNERDFYVTTDAAPGVALHDEPLKKSEVKGFLSEYGAEEE